MTTTAARTRDGSTAAERATQRLVNAEMLDRQRPASGCSFDPVRMAASERREAAAEIAGSDTAAAVARGHRPPS